MTSHDSTNKYDGNDGNITTNVTNNRNASTSNTRNVRISNKQGGENCKNVKCTGPVQMYVLERAPKVIGFQVFCGAKL